MFDHLVEANRLEEVMKQHGLELPEDLDFIKEQIAGPMNNGASQHRKVTVTVYMVSRGFMSLPWLRMSYLVSSHLPKQQMLSDRQKLKQEERLTSLCWSETAPFCNCLHGFLLQSAVFGCTLHFFNQQKADLLIFFSVIFSVAVQRPSTGEVLPLWDSGQQEKWHRRGQVGLLFTVWMKILELVHWLLAVVCVYSHTLSTLSSGTATIWESRIFLTISASWNLPGCVKWMGKCTFAQETRC